MTNYNYKALPHLTGFYAESIWDLLQHEFYKDRLSQKEVNGIMVPQKRKENTFKIDFDILVHGHIREELKVFLVDLINKGRVNHEDSILALLTFSRLIIKYLNAKTSIISILDIQLPTLLEEYPPFLADNGRKAYIKHRQLTSEGYKYVEDRYKAPLFAWACDFHEFISNHNKVALDILEEDIWYIKKLPFTIEGNHSYNNSNQISFLDIEQPEIRQVVKLWARYRLTKGGKGNGRKLGTISNDINSLRVFSVFLAKKYPKIKKLSSLQRKHIVAFFVYLKSLGIARKSRAVHIGKLRILLTDAQKKRWDAPMRPLIYDNEASMGRKGGGEPRVLPKEEMKLLEEKSDLMPPLLKRVFRVLHDTGIRIGDVLSLKVDNIKKGKDGEYYLTYPQHKSNGAIHSIDLRSAEMSKLRLALEEAISSNGGSGYVFPSITSIKKPYPRRGLGWAMRKFIADQNIMFNGKLITFKAHDTRRLKVTKGIKDEEDYEDISEKKIGHRNKKSTDPYVGGVSDMEAHEDTKKIRDMDDELIAELFEDISSLFE